MKLVLRLVLLAIVLGVVVLVWFRGREAAKAAVGPARVEVGSHSAPGDPTPPASEAPAREATRDSDERDVAVASKVETPTATAPATGPLLKVRVFDKERGAPIPHERVYARERKAKTWHSAWVDGSHAKVNQAPLTDGEGRAELEVEAGRDLRVWSGEHEREGVDVPALGALEVREITLALVTEPDLKFFGRVVDAETNRALAGAVVNLRPNSNDREAQPEDVRAGADGTFELAVRSWSDRFANVIAEGYARAVFPLEEGHETLDRALELRLSRGASAEVVVRDSRGAVVGARVEFTTDTYRLQQGGLALNFLHTPHDPAWSAVTDASGHAQVSDLPPRVPLALSVRASDHPPRTEGSPIALDPGERRRIEISFGSGAAIVGRIADGSNAPVASCDIWLVAAEIPMPQLLRTYRQPVAQTTSDEQGGFRFDDVPAGAWLVGPRPFAQWNPDASEDRPVGLAQLVRVEASSGTLAVELRVDRGLFIAGVVLDTRDEPVAECSVGVQMDGALVVEHDDTDESGRFRIGPLPAGNYSVRAGGLSKYAPSEPVSAAAGATDVVIHVNPGGSIRVRIVDSQGVLRTSDVILSSSDAQLGWMGTTAENGAALFEGLSSGTYAVIATASDGSFGRRSGLVLDAGTVLDAVEVVLAPGARLLLRYEGADAVANCRITAEGEFVGFGSVERGVESPCVVPPGALEVHWLRPPDGADVIQRVTLQPGEQRELVWDGNP